MDVSNLAQSPLALFLLVLNSLCLALTAAAVALIARELRGTLRRLNTVLPESARTLREARQALRHLRRIGASGHQAARRIEQVVSRACDAASEALEQATLVKQRTMDALLGRFGNGTSAEPRSRHRRKS